MNTFFNPYSKGHQARKKVTSVKRDRYTRKVKSVRELDQKLWPVFSKFIRLRDSDEHGQGRCFSCDKSVIIHNEDGFFNDMVSAGHYHKQGSNFRVLKYHERNVHVQCYDCNIKLDGNPEGYRKNLIIIYGAEVLDELESVKKSCEIWTAAEYELNLTLYRNMNKIMLKKRGLK